MRFPLHSSEGSDLRRPLDKIYASLPIPIQNLMCTADGYRRFRQRFTRHFHACLAQWEESVDRPLAWHHENQWRQLKVLIERARNDVYYYRFLPEPIETGEAFESITQTLNEIPPLEKSVYRARTADFLSSRLNRVDYTRRFTSGTTGTALKIFDSADRLAENYAVVWRQRRSFGVDLGDPFLAFTGQMIVPITQTDEPFWRRDYHSKRTLFSIYHMSPKNLVDYVDPIHDSEASYVEGYPSALHLVSRAMIESGRCLPAGRLKAVFTSSESLLAYQRERIEEAFGAPIRDHYASTEHVVAMTSCRLGRLHVDMEFGIVEVEPMEETEEWVRGPLLVTGLGNPPAPMIRYRIGDIGTRLKAPCECGRPGDVYLDIDGRIEDYVVTQSGRLIGRLDHVFKGRSDIVESQILQSEASALVVHVVPSGGYSEDSRRRLVSDLHERVGREMKIEIRELDRIEREPNGKFRAVKSTVAGLRI